MQTQMVDPSTENPKQESDGHDPSRSRNFALVPFGVSICVIGVIYLLYIFAICRMIDPRLSGIQALWRIVVSMVRWPILIDTGIAATLIALGVISIVRYIKCR